jgi:hypothetical protein
MLYLVFKARARIMFWIPFFILQIKLRTLRILDSKCTSVGLTGHVLSHNNASLPSPNIGYSFKILQSEYYFIKLQRFRWSYIAPKFYLWINFFSFFFIILDLMHLQFNPLKADIVDAFLSEFDFPNLRYFHFTIELNWETDDNRGRYYDPSQGNDVRSVLKWDAEAI